MDDYSRWNLIIGIVGAASNAVLALLAVFGANVRRWLFRPILTVNHGDKVPYVEHRVRAVQEQPTRGSKEAELRLRVRNTGKANASGAKVISEVIYKAHAGGRDSYYEFARYAPRELLWCSGASTQDVVPHIASYFAVARIVAREESTLGSAVGPSQRDDDYALFILVEDPAQRGVYTDVGNGTVLVPLVIYADNAPAPLEVFVELFWNGVTPEALKPSEFFVKLISKTDFDKRIGGAGDSSR